MGEKSGADILVEALCDLGVEVVFGYPGGAVLRSMTRCSGRTPTARGSSTSSSATNRRRRMRRKAMPARPASPASSSSLRPRRDQCGHRHHRCAARFDPDGRHHRPGSDRADRHRCVPGSRHGRHHAPLHQAQLSGEGPGEAGPDDPRGVPYRDQRPSRPRRRRHPQGRPGRDRALHQARPDPAQDVSSRASRRRRARSSRSSTCSPRRNARSSIPVAASSIRVRRRRSC